MTTRTIYINIDITNGLGVYNIKSDELSNVRGFIIKELQSSYLEEVFGDVLFCPDFRITIGSLREEPVDRKGLTQNNYKVIFPEVRTFVGDLHFEVRDVVSNIDDTSTGTALLILEVFYE